MGTRGRFRDLVTRIIKNNEIYTSQVDRLYNQTPMVLTVNLVNSALVAVVLALYSGETPWLIFLVLTVVLTALRLIGWRLYYSRVQPDVATTKWALLAIAGSGLSGAIWGVGSALLLPGNLVEETFVAFVIGGMCVASLISFSYYFPAFVAYVFPAVLPMAGRFFWDGWPIHGDMMVVFAVTITLAAYNSARGFAIGLHLNLDLTKRTRELTAANSRLELEMLQRGVVEDQLRQAHKMEAIGQLTGGIAHDFNNLLTAVIGHLEMAEARICQDPGVTALLQAALRAADRGATLTRHLLAFARRQHLEPMPIDATAVVDSVAKMLRRTIGPDIRLAIRAEPGLPPAWVDPNQLELAILNLALNARDAMPDGGILHVDLAHTQAHSGSPPDLECGEYVIISVSDTGTGMNPETLARVFEPFFTTKEAGRGSGLGLSIVHGFAAQSGGSVRITSSPGKGTKVDLWLPRATGEAVNCAEWEPDHRGTQPGQARILVCDDDTDVRAVVGLSLRDSGYAVWEAESPAHAFEILEREQPMDLLVVDYAMPGMNGLAVIDRALARHEGLKALLISGHAEILHAGVASGVPLLAKPFKVVELRRRIAETLFAPSPDADLGALNARVLAVPG
jgi:signal transduction histidine kinase/ActR/RegA family two-component response regulator